MKILLIPDSHITQTTNLARFVGLGELIAKEKPEVIISMRDFCTFNSLCHWDREKRFTMEGRRYHEEVKVANTALDLIEVPIHRLQEEQRRSKAKLYRPIKYFLSGNHEFWIHKFIEQNPSMYNQINVEYDLKLNQRGWEVIPFKEYLELEGIWFTHVPFNGSQQPISGNDICQVASRYTNSSLIFAHSHRFETKNYRRIGKDGIMQIMTCGCFFETADESQFNLNSWKGVVLLDTFDNGRFDFQTYAMDRLSMEVG